MLAVALSAAAVFAFVRSGSARTAATDAAARDARVIAETKLAPLFDEDDLSSPVTGNRYEQIAAGVNRSILAGTAIRTVTVWSDVGRVIFATDRDLVGTRPTYIRDLVYAVANGTTRTRIEAGTLKTFTPIWREPGGTVVVAELDQPFGPIAGTAGRMLALGALVLGVASLASWVLFAMTWRSGAASAPRRPPLSQGAAANANGSGGRARALGPVMAAAPPSVMKRAAASSGERAPKPHARQLPGLQEAERARSEAEQRAAAAEERLSKLQERHKQAMDQLRALEDRLSAAVAAPKHTQEELRALRDQVRDSAERLHNAETENEQLRARLGAPDLPGAVGAGESAR
jgi:hypothetical protein